MRIDVSKVKLSPKFQVVIPQLVRKKLDLKPGEQIVVIEKEGIIHLIPLKPIKQMRGFAKDADTKAIREEEDRI